MNPGMKLADYLFERNISTAEFALKINATQAAVSRYATGKRIPGPDIMSRIFAATSGAVSPNDFYGITGSSLNLAEAQT